MGRGEERGRGLDGQDVAERFQALRNRLADTAYYVLGHREDAREAVQEAFLRCWRARDGLAGARDLDAWLFAVVLITSKDLRRRRAVRRAEPLPAEESMPRASSESDPPDAAERREALAPRARRHPPPARGGARGVPLRQNGDLPFEAIAAALGTPAGTAKTRMRAALQRPREALEPAAVRTARTSS